MDYERNPIAVGEYAIWLENNSLVRVSGFKIDYNLDVPVIYWYRIVDVLSGWTISDRVHEIMLDGPITEMEALAHVVKQT